MGKIQALLVALSFSTPLLSFEKLPVSYYISYGNVTAPIQVVEYVSLACPKCLELFRKDFSYLKQQHIASGRVCWTFHPDPADILTLQAMVCLEKLSPKEKIIFWEVVLENLNDPESGCFIMQTAMESLNKPIPDLDNVEFLKNQPAFQHASTFLKQPDMITELPTVEINGKLYDAFPSRRFLEKTILSLVRSSP